MELEPLFACNLKCGGCVQDPQHPASVLKQRMPVEQAVAAVEECGALMVSMLLAQSRSCNGRSTGSHPNCSSGKKFPLSFCTNAILLPKHIDKFKPNKNFAWMVHLDGIGERHDEAVSKEGVFEQAVAAIKLAKQKGFQVYTNTTVFNTETPQDLIATLDYINDEPGVDRAGNRAQARVRQGCSTRTGSWASRRPRELFSKALAAAAKRSASTTRSCTWTSSRARPTSSARRGASRCTASKAGSGPCYLLDDGMPRPGRSSGRARTGTSLAVAKDPRCDNCMAHCGYEPTAVLATMGSLKESLRALVG